MKIAVSFVLSIVLILFCGCESEGTVSVITEYSSATTEKFKQDYVYTAEEDIVLVDFSGKVKRGSYANITVKGEPNQVYGIKVIYSSGESKSSSLCDKTTDNNGYCTWVWRTGSNAKLGAVKVVITYNGKTALSTELILTDK